MRGLSCIVLARQRAADRLASMRWAYIRAFRPLPMYRTTPSTKTAYTYADRVSERGLADVRTWVFVLSCPQLTLHYFDAFPYIVSALTLVDPILLPQPKNSIGIPAPSEFAETPFGGRRMRGSRAAQARLFNP
jgi:hypothetical protein